MGFKTLARGEIANTRCSIVEPIFFAVQDWINAGANGTANGRNASIPNRSQLFFAERSIHRTRLKARLFKSRPVIAAETIQLDSRMRTKDFADVFAMATFEKRPVVNLPPLYRHFVRHTNSPDTPPWPADGSLGEIQIEPRMHHPNQYVLAVPMTLPPDTEIRFHDVWDVTAGMARYVVEPLSMSDLEESYAQLLRKLPPDLADARTAIAQARNLLHKNRSVGCQERPAYTPGRILGLKTRPDWQNVIC